MPKILTAKKITATLYERVRAKRIATWQRVRGLWKDRRPDPIVELRAIRSSWKREG